MHTESWESMKEAYKLLEEIAKRSSVNCSFLSALQTSRVHHNTIAHS